MNKLIEGTMNEEENKNAMAEKGETNKMGINSEVKALNISDDKEIAPEAIQSNYLAIINDVTTKAGDMLVPFSRTNEEMAEHDGVALEQDVGDYLIDMNQHFNQHLCFKILKAAQVLQLREMWGVVKGEEYYVFATYCNESGGRRKIGIKILFKNGVITDMIFIRQADLQKMKRYISKNSISKITTPEEKIFQRFNDDIQDYSQQGIELNAKLIVTELSNCLNKIGEKTGYTDLTDVMSLLSDISNYTNMITDRLMRAFVRGTTDSMYYRFTSERFALMAKEFSKKPDALLKILDEYNLLYVPESSRRIHSMQTRVRGKFCDAHVETDLHWVYMILKPEYFGKAFGNSVVTDGKCEQEVYSKWNKGVDAEIDKEFKKVQEEMMQLHLPQSGDSPTEETEQSEETV